MTRSRSAAAPISSVITVDGVSGEMAIPARIPRWCIVWMRDRGSAGITDVRSKQNPGGRQVHTGGFVMETVESTSGVCDIVHPLMNRSEARYN
jgi:hypothetical protein